MLEAIKNEKLEIIFTLFSLIHVLSALLVLDIYVALFTDLKAVSNNYKKSITMTS